MILQEMLQLQREENQRRVAGIDIWWQKKLVSLCNLKIKGSQLQIIVDAIDSNYFS